MLRTVFSVIATMIISFFAGWFAHGAFGDVYFGRAEAIDGTTLKVGRSEFDLLGISSPDIGSDQGREAKDYLTFVMTDQFVWCRHEGDMDGERRVGKCYAGLENLNERMVAEGFARDCFATSDGEFAGLEARARGMGRGMWEDNRMPEAPAFCRVADVEDEETESPLPDLAEDLIDPLADEASPDELESDALIIEDTAFDQEDDTETDEVTHDASPESSPMADDPSADEDTTSE